MNCQNAAPQFNNWAARSGDSIIQLILGDSMSESLFLVGDVMGSASRLMAMVRGDLRCGAIELSSLPETTFVVVQFLATTVV